jgi:hypothetical protein
VSGEFTEDDVANDFVDSIATDVVSNVGRSLLRPYGWASDDEDSEWPFVVVRDGREFEVDIDVRVTELTPERKAAREEEAKRVLAMLERHGMSPEARS